MNQRPTICKLPEEYKKWQLSYRIKASAIRLKIHYSDNTKTTNSRAENVKSKATVEEWVQHLCNSDQVACDSIKWIHQTKHVKSQTTTMLQFKQIPQWKSKKLEVHANAD